MVMNFDDEPSFSNNQNKAYIADALEVVKLKFVDNIENLEETPGFTPEFAYQHFGDSEKIIGYKNLDVTLAYSDPSMYLYPQIKYDEKVDKEQLDIEPDDIIYKVKDQLPVEQLDMMVTDIVEFKKKLEEQKQFHPYGQVVGVVRQPEGGEQRVYKVTEYDEGFARYLARMETLSLWYIERADYTDSEDPQFWYYTMFDVHTSPEDGRQVYKLMAYASLYNFYAHPFMIRPRIAQILILPSYRSQGVGAQFLRAINADLRKNPKVKDMTAEAPADAFIFLRDYVDFIDCKELESFSKDSLMKGYTKAMAEEARTKLKIHPNQSRRVYEILRLYYTDMSNPAEEAAYKALVKARLERPMRREKADWTKLRKALNEEEFSIMVAANSEERHQEVLEQNYQKVLEEYQLVLERLKKHEGI